MDAETRGAGAGAGTGRLDGKVALITGAGRGQGEAEARLFASEGAQVVVADVLDAETEAVAASIGDAAVAVHHDVTRVEDWEAACRLAVDRFGHLDVLVNNAAIHWIRPLLDEDPDSVRRIMDVNLIGPMLGMQAVTPLMAGRGGGAIVNISSLAGQKGFSGHTAYGATKWALRGITQTAALELGPLGIRVNAVFPGSIETAMLPRSDDPAADAARFADLPLGRSGGAIEVAEVTAFLASDASSYLTGAELVVDGGSMVGRVPGR